MSALSVNKLVQEEIACEYENALVERSKHHNMLGGGTGGLCEATEHLDT